MAVGSSGVHQSFVSIGRYRYAVAPAVLSASCAAVYFAATRHHQENGGTVLGLTSGTLAAVLILILMGYGIRRRSFRSSVGSASRWLSIHVYLGLCTVFIASLHCGMNFGRNVHTAAYVLLCAVVASGCWGVYAYLRYPAVIARIRGNTGRDQLLRKVADLDASALALTQPLSGALRDLVRDSIRRTCIGGGLWTQLRARDTSTLLIGAPIESGFTRVVGNAGQRTLIDILAREHAAAKMPEVQNSLSALLEVAGEKAVVQRKLQRDIQLQGLMQFWLYLHLPLSFALLAALTVHVITVFFYR